MKYLVTVLLTIGATVGGIVGFMFGNGIMTVSKVEQQHNSQVYVDGELVNEHSWNELFGVKFDIDLVDEAYIGK